MRYTLLTIFLIAQCSCSGLIDRSTNKHRGVFEEGNSRIAIRKKIGPPVDSWEKNSKLKSTDSDSKGAYAHDTFQVRGIIARPCDGMVQIATAFMTYGLSEVICMPLTLFKVTLKPLSHQKVKVFYNKSMNYKTHQIYDCKGAEISR